MQQPLASTAAAQTFAEALVGLDPHAAEFRRRLHELDVLGADELRASSELCRAVADRQAGDHAGFRQAVGRLAAFTGELRKVARTLEPSGQIINAEAYFEGYLQLEPRLLALVTGLSGTLEAVRRHQLSLENHGDALSTAGQQLAASLSFAQALDRALEARIALLGNDQSERAQLLRQDALRPLRERCADLLAQLTVVNQAIVASRGSAAAARRLVDGIDHLRAETAVALRVAVVGARLLIRRRVILDQLRLESEAIAALIAPLSIDRARGETAVVADPMTPAEQWRKLEDAWRRVERAAGAVAALRASVG